MSRRLLAASALVAALLAVVTLPALAQPAPTPTVAIDTFRTLRAGGCANPGDNFDLVAGGTSNQTTVTLSLYSPSGAFLTSGSGTTSSGRWSANFVFNYTQTGLYEVRATAGKPQATSSAWLEVPCQPPTLEYDPTCFTPGVTTGVTMTVRHFAPFGTGYMTYDVGGSETQQRIRIPADGHGVFSAVFNWKPPQPANRDHPGEGTDSNRTLVAAATWSPCPPPSATTTTSTTEPPVSSTTAPPVTISVPTSGTTVPVKSTTTTSIVIPPITPGATLTVTPMVGPPGFVARATGTGFPAGPVQLVWTPGIGRTPVVAGPDGAFTTQVLVFPKDRLGPRTLLATGGGGVSANAAFLVVPPTVEPSSGSDVNLITRTRRFSQR